VPNVATSLMVDVMAQIVAAATISSLSCGCAGGAGTGPARDSRLPARSPTLFLLDRTGWPGERRDVIMTITEQPTEATGLDAVDEAAVFEFVEQVAGHQAYAWNATLAYLGDRLGLWRALADGRPTTSADLAVRTGTSQRYLQEWLAAQAAAGYLVYDAEDRTFRLPAAHAAVLAVEDSPAAMAGSFETIVAVASTADRLAHAFVTGEGIGWHEQDSRVFSGVERFFRPLYASSLLTEWLPAVDGLVDRLNGGIDVLDVGCGLGTPTLQMAEAFPASRFVGVDYHDESIRRASATALRTGLSDRVQFVQADAQDPEGRYDLVIFFDALHDMGDPVGALRHAASRLTEDGLVVAVEPAAADRLEDNLHPLGLAWYAASTALCVPNSLSQEVGTALGAQAGTARLLEVFAEAGLRARAAATTMFNVVLEGRRA
jgi:SAM-dependent methyltransferase